MNNNKYNQGIIYKRDRQTDRKTETERQREIETERQTGRQADRQRQNSNSKPLFYEDCPSGSVKTCLTTSPC